MLKHKILKQRIVSMKHLCDSSRIKVAGGQVRRWKGWAGLTRLPPQPTSSVWCLRLKILDKAFDSIGWGGRLYSSLTSSIFQPHTLPLLILLWHLSFWLTCYFLVWKQQRSQKQLWATVWHEMRMQFPGHRAAHALQWALPLSLATTKGPLVPGKYTGCAHTHTHAHVKAMFEHVPQQKHGADTTSPFSQKVSNWKQKIVSGLLGVWSHPQRWYRRPSVGRHVPLLPPALPPWDLE